MSEVKSMRQVPLLDLKAQTQSLRPEIEQAISSVLDKNDFILGRFVADLEEEVARYCECRGAAAVASGTDALLLALRAYGVGPGDEVVTSPYTFFATAGAIHNVGARPVFADIDPVHFNLRPEAVEDCLSSRTRAVIPVHLYGQCAPLPELRHICRDRGLSLIEDAAQAIGARQTIDGTSRMAGQIGDCGCLSFFPSKNLGGIGDGGMIVSDSDDLIQKVKILRVHGSAPKYYHHVVGYNSRLDTINAAVLRVKLPHLDRWTEGRRENACRYNRLFAQADLQEFVKLPSAADGNYHIFNQYVIQCRDRDHLQKHLQENGIGTAIYYPVPLHLQECFAYLGYKAGDFPVSEQMAKTTLALPVFPELEEEDQEYVVEQIRNFYRS